MTETEFLQEVKDDVIKKIKIENRLNELNSANFLSRIRSIKEMYQLNKGIKFYEERLQLLFFLYTYRLECDLSKSVRMVR